MTYNVFSGTLNPTYLLTYLLTRDHPGEPVPEENFWRKWTDKLTDKAASDGDLPLTGVSVLTAVVNCQRLEEIAAVKTRLRDELADDQRKLRRALSQLTAQGQGRWCYHRSIHSVSESSTSTNLSSTSSEHGTTTTLLPPATFI